MKPLSRKSKERTLLQRAAGGGNAADAESLEWACEGSQKSGGIPLRVGADGDPNR